MPAAALPGGYPVDMCEVRQVEWIRVGQDPSAATAREDVMEDPWARAEDPSMPFVAECAVVGGKGTIVGYGSVRRGGPELLEEALAVLVSGPMSSLTIDLAEATGIDLEVLQAITQLCGRQSGITVLLPATGVGLDFPSARDLGALERRG